MTTLAPRNADEAIDAVRWAMSAGEALEVVGTGTRRGLGRPVDAPHVLDMSALRGVLDYEPEELTLTALPGTSLAEIESVLAERKQCLAFEPPYFAGAGLGTLGGAVSSALSGPRRLKAGAVRDHVLGLTAVSGRGELFKAGGKVVKNVTGYDLPKLITGSYGTLAVLTELTIKVLPAPEDTRTLVLSGQSAADAVRTMTGVLQSTADVSAACYLPCDVSGSVMRASLGGATSGAAAGAAVGATTAVAASEGFAATSGAAGGAAIGATTAVAASEGFAATSGAAAGAAIGATTAVAASEGFAATTGAAVGAAIGASTGAAVTAFRFEGVGPSVDFRLSRLREQLASAGAVAVLDRDASLIFWRAIRDVAPLAADSSHALWRISVPPARGAEVLARIQSSLPGARAFLDWGGGLVWVQSPNAADVPNTLAGEKKIHSALADCGGHATLVRASAEVRRNVNVFQPQASALATLSDRVKQQFDPKRVLNPGRMYAGV